MRINNKVAALLFRLALLAGCGAGMAVSSGVFHGGYTHRMLAYYTNLSNIICFAYMLIAAVHTTIGLIRNGPAGVPAPLPGLKRAFTVMITVTLLVYHFILAPTVYRMNLNYEVYSLPDILIHYFTPIMIILDWLLFDEKNVVRWYDPLLWLSIPVAYLVFTLVRAEVAEPLNAMGVRYPYYFIDVDALGVAAVARNAVVCALAFVALGYVFFAIDRLPFWRSSRDAVREQDRGF